jgi:hypothetical protein
VIGTSLRLAVFPALISMKLSSNRTSSQSSRWISAVQKPLKSMVEAAGVEGSQLFVTLREGA